MIEALKSKSGKCSEEASRTIIFKTDGLQITNLDLEDLKLRIFDLEGDIDFIESHSMFITENTLYLPLFDLRSFFTNYIDFLKRIQTLLSNLHSQAPNSSVILVGTKADGDVCTRYNLSKVRKHLKSLLQKASANHKQFFGDLKHDCFLCYPELFKYDEAHTQPTTDQFKHTEKCQIELASVFYSPHIVGYCEVSSKVEIPRTIFSFRINKSIRQLKSSILKGCQTLLKEEVPQKWPILLQEIEKQNRELKFPVITFESFEDLAAKCGFTHSDDELLSFLIHYHSSGYLIYYHKIEHLRDIIVTDPQWLSDQLRTVITFRYIPELKEGVLQHEDLKTIIWTNIPDGNHEKLIHVFRQAGIFIPVGENAELIPCRLPLGYPSKAMWKIIQLRP